MNFPYSHKKIAKIESPRGKRIVRDIKRRWLRRGLLCGGFILKRSVGPQQTTVTVNSGDDLQTIMQRSGPGTVLYVKAGSYTISSTTKLPYGVWLIGEDPWQTKIVWADTSTCFYLMGNNRVSGCFFQRNTAGSTGDEFFVNGPSCVIEKNIIYGSSDSMRFCGGVNNSTTLVQDNLFLEFKWDIFQTKGPIVAGTQPGNIDTTAVDSTATIQIRRNFFYATSGGGIGSAFFGFDGSTNGGAAAQYASGAAVEISDNFVDYTYSASGKVFAYLSFNASVGCQGTPSAVTSQRNYIRANVGTSVLAVCHQLLYPQNNTTFVYPAITFTDDAFDFYSRGTSTRVKGNTAGGGSTHGGITLVRNHCKYIRTDTDASADAADVQTGGAGQPTVTVSVADAGTRYLMIPRHGYVRYTTHMDETLVTTGSRPVGQRLTIDLVANNTTQRTITFGAGFSATGTILTSATAGNTVGVLFQSDGTNMVESTRWTN